MLKRKAMEQLNKWKGRKHKALIIDGARQVGKTFIVREFAKENYKAFYELNFLENPSLQQIFEGSLQADTLLMLIRAYFPQIKYIENETLIFLDEVQACPQAITALKFLSQSKHFDVIASGSALGMAFQQSASYPVGQVEYLRMCALDFEEFLWARGIDKDLIKALHDNFKLRTPVHPALHEKLMKLLLDYLMLGGMPEVVNSFVLNNDYIQADKIQRNLHKDYIADIAHYADPITQVKAVACYRSIPAQLIKENHKFQYGIVEHKGTARKFESSVDWLESAHFTVSSKNLSKLEYPLEYFTKDNNFRLYPTDIGMLLAMYGYELKSALLFQKENTPAGNLLKTARGGLFEALAADFLYKKGFDELYFYRSDNASIEIEFILSTKDGIVPVEIKAGKNKSASLNKILQDKNIPYGYKFAAQNIGVSNKIITMPLYMMVFL